MPAAGGHSGECVLSSAWVEHYATADDYPLFPNRSIEVTKEWWGSRRNDFTLFISQVVIDEVARGDSEISLKRLEMLDGIPQVALNQAVRSLAAQFLSRSNLPAKASDDAVHIAAATVHNLDYLLTWNCKYIANAQIQRKLEVISLDFGYRLPVICTPYELLGD